MSYLVSVIFEFSERVLKCGSMTDGAYESGYKQEMTTGFALYHSASPARRRISTRNLRCCRGIGNSFVMRTLVTAGLVWALCCVSLTSCNRDLDSDLVDTETGWRFGDDDGDIDTFDGPAPAPAIGPATAPAPAAKPQGGVIPLINGDFELTNITAGSPTTLADNTSTAIVNWTPGGNGVQILQSATYGQPSYMKTKSVICIHMNNPSLPNFTQGSLSTTLATAPASGKSYTVQYDICRAPDGPLNLWTALRVSALQGATVHDWVIHNVVYNVTDTLGHSTWSRQSFVYTGTGASTVIKFESMSEKYGPIIDNVQILSGKHPLAGAPLGKMSGMCQRILPFVTVFALASFHIF